MYKSWNIKSIFVVVFCSSILLNFIISRWDTFAINGINVNTLICSKFDIFEIIYIIFVRIKQIFIIVLVSYFFDNNILKSILCVFGGIIISAVLVIQGYMCSFDEYVILLIYVLPQLLLYCSAIKLICFENFLDVVNYKKILCFCALVVSGISFECYFSKKIVYYFINILLQK